MFVEVDGTKGKTLELEACVQNLGKLLHLSTVYSLVK